MNRCPKAMWIYVLGIPLLGIFVGIFVGSCTTPSAVITGYDQLALPDEKITIEAKLERKGGLISPDIHGEKLEFVRIEEGKESSLGPAETGDDGRAKMSFTAPSSAGMVEIRVRLMPASKLAAKEAPILIVVAKSDAPFVVTDIDHTIADISELKFLTTENEKVQALLHSPDVLSELAKKYTVIYLTARDDQFTGRTKDWLALRKFPEGPVLFRKLTLKNLSAESYKTHVLKQLTKKWSKIEWGFGERDEDMRAYGTNGIKGIQIAPKAELSRLAGDPPLRVRSWDEILKIIK